MNLVIIAGRVSKEVEVRYTQSGKCVAGFSVAVNNHFNKDNKADFFNIVAWQKLAEICGNCLVKGIQVLIEGRLQTRSYDAQDGSKRYVTEIIANEVEFMGSKPKEQQGNSHSDVGTEMPDTEEIPF